MDRKSFLQAGHTPTLLAAFLYFDLAFMVWVILGPLGVQIASDLGLSTRTIDHYVGAVCKKLGAKSRAQAVATALKMTLISPPQT